MQLAIVGVLFIVLSSFFSSGLRSLSIGDVGYSTAFQGPKIWFYGQEWNRKRYTPTATTLMSFNPDGADNGLPAVYGEMTSIFHPDNSLSFANWPSWNPVPPGWTQNLGLRANDWNGQIPEQNYSWIIGDKTYYMAQYRMKWYVSFNSWATGEGEIPYAYVFNAYETNTYKNLKVWFKIDTSPTWYFEGAEKSYFAIGSIRLSEVVRTQSSDVNKQTYPARTSILIQPQSQSSQIMIYKAAWGERAPEATSQTFQGKKLNPDYFRNSTYTMVELSDFGIDITYTQPIGPTTTKGDVATFAFEVIVYAIGEYKVQDVQRDPSEFGKFTPVTTSSNILNWLFSPATLAWIVPIVIFILLLFFAPWVLVALINMFRSVFGGKK